ncbi:MAG: hypothetical protein ACR2HT_04255 [Pyrinomonadaceae bacterium]
MIRRNAEAENVLLTSRAVASGAAPRRNSSSANKLLKRRSD